MNDNDQIIALAGVCQAGALVQQIARQGECDEAAYVTSLNSILVTDPDSPAEIFGSLVGMQLGFKVLCSQLSNKAVAKDAEITRYVASIMALERKLSKQGDKMQELANRIEQIKRQTEHYNLFEPQMLNNLASIYSDLLSPLAPRIQVAGNPTYLKQSIVQHKVRAVLLAGIRFAVLWRQLGGRRRQILLKRRHILKQAEHLQHNSI